MQGQNHYVHGHSLLQICKQFVAQVLVGLSDNSPARLCKGADTLHHLPAPCFGALPPNQKLSRALVGRLSRGVTMGEEAVFEARPTCGDRRESISLGVKARYENFHVCVTRCVLWEDDASMGSAQMVGSSSPSRTSLRHSIQIQSSISHIAPPEGHGWTQFLRSSVQPPQTVPKTRRKFSPKIPL